MTTRFVEMRDKLGWKAKMQMDIIERLENTVGFKTSMIKDMLKDCIKNLKSIPKANRAAFETSLDVIAQRDLLFQLIMLADGTQFTIRK